MERPLHFRLYGTQISELSIIKSRTFQDDGSGVGEM